MPLEFHIVPKLLVDPQDDEDLVHKKYVDDLAGTGTGGGVDEVPDDDKLYGRMRAAGAANGTWEEITGGAGGVTIDDTTPSTTTVFSSDKTLAEIDALINDAAPAANTTYSSDKIETELANAGGGAGVTINDTTPSASTVFSSNKTLAEIEALINDTAASTTTTYSSNKIATDIAAAGTASATEIPAGDDLDTYYTSGRYYGLATGITNLPETSGESFNLAIEQLGAALRKQTFWAGPYQAMTMYVRSCNSSGVWGSWMAVLTAPAGDAYGDLSPKGHPNGVLVTKIQGTKIADPLNPTNGQVLAWNATATQWEPLTPAAGTPTLTGDVTGNTGASVVERIRGRTVVTTAPTAGQVLGWNSLASQWEPQTPSGNAVQIQGRTVAASAPTAGQLLTWNALASQWEPQAAAGLIDDVTASTTRTFSSTKINTELATKQNALAAAAANNVLIAPTTAGGAPTTKPITDFATIDDVSAAATTHTWSSTKIAAELAGVTGGGGTGGAAIDDATPSLSTTFSGTKIVADLALKQNVLVARTFTASPTTTAAGSYNGSADVTIGIAPNLTAGTAANTLPTAGTATALTTLLNTTRNCLAWLVGRVVPAGGTANQVLAKASATDHDLTWMTPATGGGDVTMVGDVTGASYANTVEKVRGRTVATTTPSAGQALTWNSTASQWEPVTLAGDVTGAVATNTVARIQGRAVATTAPTANQLLTWNGTTSAWTPTTYAPTLAGDVTGALGTTTVARIRGSDVSTTAPVTGQALVWSGTAWTPTSGGAYGAPDTIAHKAPLTNVHTWIPSATQGLFAGEAISISTANGAPSTARWRYLANSSSVANQQSILALGVDNRLLQKTNNSGTWSAWTEYAGLNAQPNFSERDPTQTTSTTPLGDERISGAPTAGTGAVPTTATTGNDTWRLQSGTAGITSIYVRGPATGVAGNTWLAYPINPPLPQNTAVEVSFTASASTLFMAFRSGVTGAYGGVSTAQQTVTVSSGLNTRDVSPTGSATFNWLVVSPGNSSTGSALVSHVGNTFQMHHCRMVGTPIIEGTLSKTLTLKSAFDVSVYGSGATASLFIGGGGSTCRANGNLAIGRSAANAITTGQHNVFLGRSAGAAATTSSYNVAVGYAALAAVTSGYNVALGYNAMASATIGYNVAIGLNALRSVTTGSENVAIGDTACGSTAGDGYTCISATYGVFIGYNTKAAGSGDSSSTVASGTNEIVIGYNAVGGGSNTVTLGNTSITRLRAQVTAITSTSDRRLKENIQPANLDMCIDAVKAIPVRRWGWRGFMGNRPDRHVTGFIADDVEKVFPKSVDEQDMLLPVYENGKPKMRRFRQLEEGQEEEQPPDPNDPNYEPDKEEPEMFLMKHMKSLTMDQGLPTLWGAVQRLIQRVEELEEKSDAITRAH